MSSLIYIQLAAVSPLKKTMADLDKHVAGLVESQSFNQKEPGEEE